VLEIYLLIFLEEKSMKGLLTICAVCACVLLTTTAAWGSIASMSVNTIISFDENGNGTWEDVSGNITPLTFGIGVPPSGGHATLYYELTAAITEGDLGVTEPSSTLSVQLSDLLRFSGYCVYVYSDLPEAGQVGELADTGIPTQLLDNLLSMTEEGSEGGWNGVHYTPLSGQPGYIEGLEGSLTYVFTSDVPEPTTIALLGLGALCLLKKRRA
jgi:hypothetical protein